MSPEVLAVAGRFGLLRHTHLLMHLLALPVVDRLLMRVAARRHASRAAVNVHHEALQGATQVVHWPQLLVNQVSQKGHCRRRLEVVTKGCESRRNLTSHPAPRRAVHVDLDGQGRNVSEALRRGDRTEEFTGRLDCAGDEWALLQDEVVVLEEDFDCHTVERFADDEQSRRVSVVAARAAVDHDVKATRGLPVDDSIWSSQFSMAQYVQTDLDWQVHEPEGFADDSRHLACQAKATTATRLREAMERWLRDERKRTRSNRFDE
ncbi:hypothetical protein PG993_013710 [Apiospora rasikravindrae]|uniref:Uncharacterized protein n=1 Tax=Apiospora rasikravindrae TaxID=990691 RepID=A0ABR1RQY5_9PEZI